MNLLPESQKNIVEKGSKLRFWIVVMVNVSAALLMSAILLLPSYFIAGSKLLENKSKAQMAGSKNRETISKLLELPKEINMKLRIMRGNQAEETLMETIKKIVDAKTSGVHISSMSYTKAEKNENGEKNKIIISGVSLDRKSLIDFSQKLKENKSFSGVEVPVFSLTRERDLPFSITITIEK